jgi:Protein of unknown function (DUF3237)
MTTNVRTRERRKTFQDKSLLYLFSFDAEIDLDREIIGFVPGGLRLNIRSRPERTQVYHVLRAQTVAGLGFASITGRVRSGGDWLYWREDDLEYSTVRLTIDTDDGATIVGQYRVVADLTPGGYRRLLGKEEDSWMGTWKKPLDVPIFITPAFYSTHPDYAWLNEVFCVGFGIVRVVQSEFHKVTYDIYAVT